MRERETKTTRERERVSVSVSVSLYVSLANDSSETIEVIIITLGMVTPLDMVNASRVHYIKI